MLGPREPAEPWPVGDSLRLAEDLRSVDGRREDSNQAPQPDGRQIPAADHGANGLLVAVEPARRVGNGQEERRS